MKVFYFTPYYPPQGEAAASRAFWFVKVLERAGHDIIINNASKFKLAPASNKDSQLVRLFKENLSGMELFVKILASRNDFLILSTPPFFTVMWGAFAAILTRQRFILDVRDLYPEIFFELGIIRESSLIGILIKAITKTIYKHAHCVLTVTNGLCAEIEKYQVGKPTLIMNGFDRDVFYPGSDNEKFGVFTIVFHGTLGKVQNIDALLSLAKKLETEDIQIVVAGNGPKLENILQANLKNIKYVGNLSQTEIGQLLRKCHVGLSFRTDDKIGREAFPVKVFEYVATEIPVIMTPHSEAGNLIAERKLGFQFENHEIQNMKEQILKLKMEGWEPQSAPTDFSREEQAKKIIPLLNQKKQFFTR